MGPLWERRGRGRLLFQPAGLWLPLPGFCWTIFLTVAACCSPLPCSVEAMGPERHTQRREQLDNLARKWHFTASSHPEYHILIICLVHQCQRKMCSKIQRGITVVMDEETRDMYR